VSHRPRPVQLVHPGLKKSRLRPMALLVAVQPTPLRRQAHARSDRWAYSAHRVGAPKSHPPTTSGHARSHLQFRAAVHAGGFLVRAPVPAQVGPTRCVRVMQTTGLPHAAPRARCRHINHLCAGQDRGRIARERTWKFVIACAATLRGPRT
jgi:hypothetical protein